MKSNQHSVNDGVVRRVKHRWPGLTWWTFAGKGYSSLVLCLFPRTRFYLGLWLLWAHDLRWQRVHNTRRFLKVTLGSLLVKFQRDYPFNAMRRKYARQIRAARRTRDKQHEQHHRDFYSFRAKCLRDASRVRCLPNRNHSTN